MFVEACTNRTFSTTLQLFNHGTPWLPYYIGGVAYWLKLRVRCSVLKKIPLYLTAPHKDLWRHPLSNFTSSRLHSINLYTMGGMLYWLCMVLMTISWMFNQSTMVGVIYWCVQGGEVTLKILDFPWLTIYMVRIILLADVLWKHKINQFCTFLRTVDINWWAPSSSETIHNWPFGLNSLAKPGMASQNDARSCVDISSYRTNRRNFLRRFSKSFLAS